MYLNSKFFACQTVSNCWLFCMYKKLLKQYYLLSCDSIVSMRACAIVTHLRKKIWVTSAGQNPKTCFCYVQHYMPYVGNSPSAGKLYDSLIIISCIISWDLEKGRYMLGLKHFQKKEY